MSLRNIYEQLGIEPKYEEEIAKLNKRIILTLDNFHLKFYESNYLIHEIYPTLVKEFAFLVGESNIYRDGPAGRYYLPLKHFFKCNKEKDVFQTNIKNLTFLLEASKKVLWRTTHQYLYTFILSEAKRAIEVTPIDVGYLFSGETIIKKGARELDEKLILENLTWLSNYPAIKQLFENSLKHYLAKDYPDAITNAYSSLEGLAKTFLNRDKRLDNNETKRDLIKQLGLEEDWGQLLYFYCKLAHEFSSRHGKKETGEPLLIAMELAEFYIYITGSFMRLISQIIKGKKNKHARNGR
jgi:hypothetical protein